MRVGVTGLKWVVGVGICVVYSSSAMAQSCVYNTGTSEYDAYQPDYYDIQMTSTQSTVAVPLSANVGDVVLTLTGKFLIDPRPALQANIKTGARYVPIANCPGGSTEEFRMANNLVAGYSDVYATNVSNIGYRAYYPGRSTPGNYLQTSNANDGKGNSMYFPAGQTKVEFILLSGNWSGTRAVSFPIDMAYTAFNGGAGYRNSLLRYRLMSAVTFVPEPCQFTTNTDMRVELSPVIAEDLPQQVGASYQGKDFSMTFNCPRGVTPPKVSFQGTRDASNLPGVLANDTTLSQGAQNVSVLLEHVSPGSSTSAPVDLGGVVKITDLTDLGTCSGANCQSWKLDMKASYIRTTSSTIVPGQISTRAQVTVEHP